MTDAELIERSDLVIIGVYAGQANIGLGTEGPRFAVGVITVTEVLKGPAGTTVALMALPPAGMPRSSSDLTFTLGDRGAWCLRSRPGGGSGLYLADHPQRFARLPGELATVDTLRRLATAAR